LFSFRLYRFALFLVILVFGCEDQFNENLNTTDKNIVLTFDDGPDPLYTEMILDILKEKDVKATFFLGINANRYLFICYGKTGL
jgi:peptidoglycan/xylan/chitin deacetylase (PgdA/CDA1 family)